MTFLATFDNISTLSGVIDSDDGDAQIAQLVEQWTENPCVAGSIPALGTAKCKIKYAIVAQLVEYNLAKVGVAGSSPVYRSHAGVVQW